jgi:hypothetical protein
MRTYDFYCKHFMALHTVSRFLVGKQNLRRMNAAAIIAHAFAYKNFIPI